MQSSGTKCSVCNINVQERCMKTHMTGKKHMKAVAWKNRTEKARLNGIFVRGFHNNTSSEELHTFFSKLGTVTEFVFNKHGQFAIVEFRDSSSAHKCLTRPLYMAGCRLIIKQRHIRDVPERGRHINAVREDVLNHEHIASLLASCEGPFSTQVSILLKEITSSEDNRHRTMMICGHLETTLAQAFPRCKAYPFGSSVTGLAFKGSDLDVFLDANLGVPREGETSNAVLNKAKKLLQKNGHLFSHVFAIPKAKTPIIQLVHVPTKIHCDLSFKNAFGINNSGLIRFYISLDERLLPLLVTIKYWVRKHDLCGAGKLSNYAVVMLVFCFLQQLPQPVIPRVCDLQKLCKNKRFISGWDCSYECDISPLGCCENVMTVPQLLLGFFKFYSDLDYPASVVCPLIGGVLPKTAFDEPEHLPEEFLVYKKKVAEPAEIPIRLKADAAMNVQDPFELTHNLTRGTGPKAVERLKRYCKAAAEICSEASKSDVRLLKNLFDESRIPDLPSKPAVIKLPIPNLGASSSENVENCCMALLRIFNKILKLDTQVIEQVPLNDSMEEDDLNTSKRQKLEGQLDVGRRNMKTTDLEPAGAAETEWCKSKEIRCTGKCRVWEGRKAVLKTIEFPTEVTPLMKEEMLSDFLETKQRNQNPRASINLKCLFKPKQDPMQVLLEVCDGNCSKGDYEMMSTFLQRNLYRLVNMFIKETLEYQP